MSGLPGGSASAMTRATAQLQGTGWRAERAPEPAAEPPDPVDAETVLLGELAEQMMKPLRRRDRWQVRRAVRRGRAVGDARWAPAAVAVALWTQRAAMTSVPLRRPWTLLMGPALMTLAQVLGLMDAADGLTLVRAIGFACCAGWIISTVLLVMKRPGRAARAARAEQLNRALLPPTVPPAG